MLVVGVLGLQGTGKSMVMSLLSANQPEEDQRWVGFRKRKCLAIGYRIDPKRIAVSFENEPNKEDCYGALLNLLMGITFGSFFLIALM